MPPASPLIRRPSRPALAVVTALAVMLAGWTALVASGATAGLDRATRFAGLPPGSPAAQVAAAIAVVTMPVVLYAVLLGLAVWAQRRRLKNLCAALVLTVLLGAGLSWAIKLLVGRPRPDSPHQVITAIGPAYPSSHLTAVTSVMIMVCATTVVTRQREGTQRGWQVAAAALVTLVAVDRWLMSAHWLSDLVGGVLLGALAAGGALILAGVRVLPRNLLQASGVLPARRHPADTTRRRRCAVIHNPAKVINDQAFRRHIGYELSQHGFDRTLWLETTQDDPGPAMTEIAVRKQVDLVLGAGGDGTIRAVCAGLAGTDIPLGLIPAGTGNLLARNLGIPLDERAALEVAFAGRDRHIDLIRLRVDGSDETDRFAVMGGIGADAAVFERTDADLKKAVGSAAYFVAAARAAGATPFEVTVAVDDGPPITRQAAVVLIGNVGHLQGGIEVIPGARPDDGLLEVVVASPRGMSDWVRITAAVLTRRRHREGDRLDRFTGTRVTVTAATPQAYQLDGDLVGHCRTLTAEIDRDALRLRLP